MNNKQTFVIIGVLYRDVYPCHKFKKKEKHWSILPNLAFIKYLLNTQTEVIKPGVKNNNILQ